VTLSSSPAELLRRVVNAFVGDEIRVVRVLSGVARGRRLALDLRTEKAYWLGSYERPVQRFLRENVREGDVVYDVGAHVGFFSVCAASLGARVVAVEPDAENAARLRANAELNGLPVAVVEAAAWDETGTVDLVAGGSAKEFVAVPGEGVASVSLDDLAGLHGSPTLVKLDVEGAESRVLAGARRVLAEASPVVLCELHGDEQRRVVPTLLPGYAVAELDSPYRIAAVRSPR
jgi:FkbM family methyltransferase